MSSNNAYVLKVGDNILDFSELKTSNFVIETEVNSECALLVKNMGDLESLKINLNDGSKLVLSFLFDETNKTFDFEVNIFGNASLEAYIAEISRTNLQINANINLLKMGANAVVKLASLAAENDDKKINISMNHLSSKTYGKVDNYGVCKDNGKLLFAGTSHILHNSIKSKTQQNARIMVFDEASNAIAKPILKIDENDVEASHAAVVGKINDEHLFYLTSRGISEADAKQLITLGYLKPILGGFNDDKIRSYISSLIERRM